MYDITKQRVFVEQYLYSQKQQIIRRLRELGISKCVFVHIDCDISESAKEIFSILEDAQLLADKCYLLFDDYGCETGLKYVVEEHLSQMTSNWKIEEHSKTRLTKNFRLERKR